jgi:hypothetical protein
VVVDGPTECRWAWKYNDLKPRVYYARGPDHYYPSRHVQPICNIFVDSTPITHRFARFYHDFLEYRPWDLVFIYDFGCFTSRLFEIRNFTAGLADMSKGTKTICVDSLRGPELVDVGELLHRYNEACNIDPSFDIGGLSWDRSYEEEVIFHRCGMLGVPGNISLSTLLHGIHLAIVLRSRMCKVVGDDAIGGARVIDRQVLIDQLSNIGHLHAEKMEWFEADPEEFGDIQKSWHYTKRPITRFDTRVHVGQQAVFPPIGVLLNWVDGFHTVIQPSGQFSRYKKTASMLTSYALQFSDMPGSEDDRQFADNFLRVMTQETGLADYRPSSGIAIVYPRRIGQEGFEEMVFHHWDDVVSIPEENPYIPDIAQVDREISFIRRMTRSVKLACDLGYAKADMRRRRILVREDPNALERLISGKVKPYYDIMIFESCPVWLEDLILADMDYSDIAVSEMESDI